MLIFNGLDIIGKFMGSEDGFPNDFYKVVKVVSYLRYPQSMFFGHRLTLPCMDIKACGESSINL